MRTTFKRGTAQVAFGALVITAGACAASRKEQQETIASTQRASGVPTDLRLRTVRQASATASEGSVRARAAFWNAFYAERYDAIPGLLRQLSAAVIENPRDAEAVLLLAHTHLWKVAERARVEGRDPTIIDHLVMAEHYFEEAYRLNPQDHRIIGWLGSVRVSLGAVRQDSLIAGEGNRLLHEGVQRYPQFNLFTAAFTHAGLPVDSPGFRDALQQLWSNVDKCSGVHATSAAASQAYQLALRADRSCANSTKVPHNFEGFILNLGDMLVRAGRAEEAVAVYERARLAPDFATWPYGELLERRIRNAAESVRLAREGKRTPMMAGSAYTCAGCHARR